MNSLARIPFTPADEKVLRNLCHALMAVAGAHLLGALGAVLLAGLYGLSAVGIAPTSTFGAVLFAMNVLLMLACAVGAAGQSVLLGLARSALGRVLDTDTEDQAMLSTTIRRLKQFFFLEVGWLGLAMVSAVLGLVLYIAVPETRGGDFGREFVEAVRATRGGR